jgi:cytidine deaminase
MKKTSFQKLNEKDKELLKKALEATDSSYSPYSGFCVGAAILSLDGKIAIGSNIENSAYGSTICAESSALSNFRSEGLEKAIRIAIIAGKGAGEIVSPCGNCRQLLFEFSRDSGIDIEVVMSNTEMDKIVIARISELLPLGFYFEK